MDSKCQIQQAALDERYCQTHRVYVDSSGVCPYSRIAELEVALQMSHTALLNSYPSHPQVEIDAVIAAVHEVLYVKEASDGG